MLKIIFLVLERTTLLLLVFPFNDALVTNPAVGTTSIPAQTPQYRFHYYVKDDKTGDYKAQEEHRTGDSVTGSYVVGEPNGDLRVVTYVADVSGGFKADVSVQPGASPVKVGSVTNAPKEGAGIAAFNNYRTGISAPPRNRNKPARGFNPIVVKRLSPLPPAAAAAIESPSQTPPTLPLHSTPSPSTWSSSSPQLSLSSHPYPYYKDVTTTTTTAVAAASATEDTSSAGFVYTTTQIPKKSVDVDLTFSDDTAPPKSGEVSALLRQLQPKKGSSAPASVADADAATQSAESDGDVPAMSVHQGQSSSPPSGLQQLANTAISSSIMEIMNQQHKGGKAESFPRTGDATAAASNTVGVYANVAGMRRDYENASVRSDTVAAAATTNNVPHEHDHATESTAAIMTKKVPLPQRPMRLIGLSPIYMEISQLQTISDNLTTVPQLQLEPFTNMQYATPAPFHPGPLPSGPVGPFRYLPRAVSESGVGELAFINAIPVANSIPISAPVVSPSSFVVDLKTGGELKTDGKTSPPLPPSLSPSSSSAAAPPPPLQPQPPPQPALPLCNDCLLPTNYGPYPVVKFSVPVNGANNQQQQQQQPQPPALPLPQQPPKTAPCPPTPNNTPYWAPYTPSLAYILMPTQMLKNKFNETRF